MSDKPENFTPAQMHVPGRQRDSAAGLGPLSDLEAALEAGGDQARDALANAATQLDALTQKTRRALSGGTTSVEFAQLSAVLKACEAAGGILSAAVHSTNSGATMQSNRR